MRRGLSPPFTAGWLAALALALSVLLGLGSMQVSIGYADNGDFDRSIGFALAKPTGFHSMWERSEGEGSGARFFSAWHDSWDRHEQLAPLDGKYTWSTYKLLLVTQLGFSSWLSGDDGTYSVIIGSLLSRVVLLCCLIGLWVTIARQHSPGIASVVVAICTVVLLDASFIGLLNSFYEEQMAILVLPLLAWSLLRWGRTTRLCTALVCLALAGLLGGAKTAYFYAPLLVLPLLWSRRRRAVLLLGFGLSQFTAVLPLLSSEYTRINAYHSMYFGVLLGLPDARMAALQTDGERFDARCIGVSAFMEGGTACMERADVSHLDTVALMLRQPDLGFRMLLNAVEFGRLLRPDYLSQHLEEKSDNSTLLPFNLIRQAFLAYYHVLVALAAVLAAVLLRRRTDGAAGLLRTGVFLACFGLSQYVVALADGYYELVKHLLAANYSLALASAFLLPGLAMMVTRSRPGPPVNGAAHAIAPEEPPCTTVNQNS
jgi:hypothetical protein